MEYVLRVVVADRKIAFIFSVHSLIDLAAILPFYIALGIDLRSIRAIRLLRFLRILKLARYTKAIDRLRRAVGIAREEFLVFLGGAGLLLWRSVVTLTTVGYGDVRLRWVDESLPSWC